MKLYWIRAQAPRRVLALVKYLHIDVELIEMDLMAGALQQPDYIQLNPNGKVPTLVDGDVVLWESSAIMAYLCHQAGSDMWPATNPREQAEILRWLSWNDCHWANAVSPFYFEHIVKATFKFGTVNRSLLASSVDDFIKYAKVLNDHMQDRSYVACNRLTIADFQLGSMAHYWEESEMPMASFSHIVRWIDRLKSIPAWARPWPNGEL